MGEAMKQEPTYDELCARRDAVSVKYDLRASELKRANINPIAGWLLEWSAYLNMVLEQHYDPAPDGAQFDFSTVEISTTAAKELLKGLEDLARNIPGNTKGARRRGRKRLR
jgi:hypothetical protein